jgi:hypothetical protein
MPQNHGMGNRFGLTALLLAAFAACLAHAAPPNCRPAESADDKSFENAWGIAPASMAMLRDVYRRISLAGGASPALYLCNDPAVNAIAVEVASGPHPRIVAVNTGLLAFVGSDADQLAAVIGHEFAHLTLRHVVRKNAAKQAHLEDVARDWAREVVRGGARRDVMERARHNMLSRARSVDRDAEREADDKGFSLAVRAGFDPSGARRFYQKWIESHESKRHDGYLDTHPGMGERSGYSARLEVNERFRKDAEKRFVAKDRERLGAVVERWLLEVPDSGAAAYYAGLYLMMSGKPQSLVSEAFEDAVTFFDGEGLSRLSQEDQYEARLAALALCVSLHREGKPRLALNCVQRLRHAEDVEHFKQVTGWSAFFVVPGAGGAAVPPERPLFAGQSRQGEVFMTNCSHVARERGLKDLRPWRGLREERPAGEGATTLACNPRTCDCEPLEEPPGPAIRRPRFDR